MGLYIESIHFYLANANYLCYAISNFKGQISIG